MPYGYIRRLFTGNGFVNHTVDVPACPSNIIDRGVVSPGSQMG